MTFEIIFLVSGLGIAVLLWEKMREERRQKSSLLLRLISLGDERMHRLSQLVAHAYADTKEDVQFFFRKQLPLHSKNFYYKSKTVIKERADLLIEDLRRTRFIKRKGGISEYFEALSEKENQEAEQASENEENRVE